MKRIFALLITAAMLVCSLASCGAESVENILKKADNALENTPYKLTMDVSMECDDEKYEAALESMALDSEVYFDGNNFLLEMNVLGAGINYRCVDNVIYSKMSYSGMTTKTKCEVNTEQRDEFLSDYMNSAAEFDALDFETVEITDEDGKTVIKCSKIKSNVLSEFIESQTAGMDFDLGVANVTLQVVLSDGKYESMTIGMDYEYNFGTETLDVGCAISMNFDYASGKAIEAPSDASSYKEIDFDDLLNG